jgi:DNA-binding NarL/FixJ family response regulator
LERHILIADPREIVRKGLCTIFLGGLPTFHVYEASTIEALKSCLAQHCIDLVLVSQLLITDMTILPQNKFVVVASQPDILVLREIYKYGALGYVSENVSAEFLKIALCSPKGSFLIEPALVPWIMGHFFDDMQYSAIEEFLTPREKEITNLLRVGIDRRTIAHRLHIAETTLKTHIKNIARKNSMAVSQLRWKGATYQDTAL